MTTVIRPARQSDIEALTKMTFASKRTWGYPEAYFDIWREELTITPAYIERNTVRLAETDGSLSGYYAILYNPEKKTVCGATIKKGFWLDHIFVAPDCFGNGIGTQLIQHAGDTAGRLGATVLRVLAEPNAAGFYRKMGAEYVGAVPSNIDGRTIPCFYLQITEEQDS